MYIFSITNPTFSTYNDICTFSVIGMLDDLFDYSAADLLSVMMEDVNLYYSLEYNMNKETVSLYAYLTTADSEHIYEASLDDKTNNMFVDLCKETISATVSAVAD